MGGLFEGGERFRRVPRPRIDADVARWILAPRQRPLVGGFDAWRAAGYPTESKPTKTQTPKEVAANIAKAEDNQGDEVIE